MYVFEAADVNPGKTNGNQSENSRIDTLRNAAARTCFRVVIHDTEVSETLVGVIASDGEHMISFCFS